MHITKTYGKILGRKGQQRLDHDSVSRQKMLETRPDIAKYDIEASKMTSGVFRLEKTGLVKVKTNENPFVPRNWNHTGTYYVAPPGPGTKDIFHLDSLSRLVLQDNPPQYLNAILQED